MIDLKLDFFVEPEGNMDYSISDSKDGIRVSARIYNDSEKTLYIKRAGVRITDFEHVLNGDETVVFIDSGKCAWAGVKRIDCFEGGKRFGVIEEQKTRDDIEDCLHFHRSDLQTVISSGEKSVLIGFLGQVNGANKVDVYANEDNVSVSYAEACQEFDISLQPGQELQMDDLVI